MLIAKMAFSGASTSEMISIATSSANDKDQRSAVAVKATDIQPTPTNCRRLTMGVIIVICIALSWVGAVQTTKISYNEEFSAPMFLVWFGTSWMMTLFPVASAIHFLSAPQRLRDKEAVLTYWR